MRRQFEALFSSSKLRRANVICSFERQPVAESYDRRRRPIYPKYRGFSDLAEIKQWLWTCCHWRMTWLWQDARFAIRSIGRDRGFFLTAVLALALNIGSTTAIFSVVYNVLLEPFPYKDGQHLFCPSACNWQFFPTLGTRLLAGRLLTGRMRMAKERSW